MVNTYITLVRYGRRTFSSVPSFLQENVKAGLEALVTEGRMSQETFDELIAQ